MTEQIPAEKLLQWQITAGVDETIGDIPVNRFAPVKKTDAPALGDTESAPVVFAPTPQQTESAPLPPPPTIALAGQAATLDELRAAIAAFDGCSLKETAANMVFAAGNPDARLMIIGEAPGAEEDRQGLPFVGASGHLLDLMLKSIGLDRTQVYISNILPWRPPANRKPSESEMALFTPFVRRHIALVKPDVLLLLGGSAVSALMNTNAGITKTRGRWMSYHDGDTAIDALASFHPAFLLRTPAQKKLAWRDLLTIKKRLAVQP